MKYTLPNSLYAITGWPLGQTLSPLVHNVAFQALGLNAVYLPFPVPKDKIETFVASVRLLGIRGCSVTIPHKTTVIPYLDGITDTAKLVGAVNTLYWADDKLMGDNTDVAGFLSPLEEIPLQELSVLVLGAGGAARACVAGLSLRKAKHISITTPSNVHHLPLAQEFACTPIDWAERHSIAADLLINTTPLGMIGEYEAATPYTFSQAKQLPTYVYDIVYNPLETNFLASARNLGCQCISGFAMFLGQAKAQFTRWTGQNLPEEASDALRLALKGSL